MAEPSFLHTVLRGEENTWAVSGPAGYVRAIITTAPDVGEVIRVRALDTAEHIRVELGHDRTDPILEQWRASQGDEQVLLAALTALYGELAGGNLTGPPP